MTPGIRLLPFVRMPTLSYVRIASYVRVRARLRAYRYSSSKQYIVPRCVCACAACRVCCIELHPDFFLCFCVLLVCLFPCFGWVLFDYVPEGISLASATRACFGRVCFARVERLFCFCYCLLACLRREGSLSASAGYIHGFGGMRVSQLCFSSAVGRLACFGFACSGRVRFLPFSVIFLV